MATSERARRRGIDGTGQRLEPTPRGPVAQRRYKAAPLCHTAPPCRHFQNLFHFTCIAARENPCSWDVAKPKAQTARINCGLEQGRKPPLKLDDFLNRQGINRNLEQRCKLP